MIFIENLTIMDVIEAGDDPFESISRASLRIYEQTGKAIHDAWTSQSVMNRAKQLLSKMIMIRSYPERVVQENSILIATAVGPILLRGNDSFPPNWSSIILGRKHRCEETKVQRDQILDDVVSMIQRLKDKP